VPAPWCAWPLGVPGPLVCLAPWCAWPLGVPAPWCAWLLGVPGPLVWPLPGPLACLPHPRQCPLNSPLQRCKTKRRLGYLTTLTTASIIGARPEAQQLRFGASRGPCTACVCVCMRALCTLRITPAPLRYQPLPYTRVYSTSAVSVSAHYLLCPCLPVGASLHACPLFSPTCACAACPAA